MLKRNNPVDVGKHPVIQLAIRVLFPLIVLLALYIQVHGEESPGGGFQAGALGAAAFAFYVLVFGLDAGRAMEGLARCLVAVGVGIYAFVGLVPILLGGEYLNYSKLFEGIKLGGFVGTAAFGQKFGIFAIEIGVALTVFAAFTLIIVILLEEINDKRF